VFDAIRVLDTGVVDQNIDTTQLTRSSIHKLTRRLGIHQINAQKIGFDTEFGLDTCTCFFDFLRVTKAIDDNLGTTGSQFSGNGQTDTTGGASNDSTFSFQHDSSLMQVDQKPTVVRYSRLKPV